MVSLKDLGKKLNGNYWEKGDLKRIYLDKGYNTKKMSTKTFVWQNDKGEFVVTCRVECPSQHWEWCKRQEDEIKECVIQEINNIISLMNSQEELKSYTAIYSTEKIKNIEYSFKAFSYEDALKFCKEKFSVRDVEILED